MKKLFLLSAIAVGAPFAAWSADLPAKAPPTVAVGPSSGSYIGIYGAAGALGHKFNDLVIEKELVVPGTGNLNPTGAIVGGTAGWGTWAPGAYFGFEADGGYDFTKQNTTCFEIANCKIKSGLLFTQRLVIGQTMGGLTGWSQNKAQALNWPQPHLVPASGWASAMMLGVTGGIAERRLAACVSIVDAQTCGERWLVGWTVGPTLRVPVSQSLTLSLDALYTAWNRTFVPASSVDVFPGTFKATNEIIVKGGLNWTL